VSLTHFARRVRIVKMGGRRLGPLHFGGGRYEVRPLTVIGFVTWWQSNGRVSEILARGEGVLLGVKNALTKAVRIEALRAMAPAILQQAIPSKHLLGATEKQLLALHQAFAEVNDLEYLYSKMGAGSGSGSMGLDALACHFAKEHGLDPAEVLHWPVQTFFAALDADVQDALHLPAGGRPLNDRERRQQAHLFEILGVH
jgi:hypothetical protein